MENKLYFQRKVMLHVEKHEKKVKKVEKLEKECDRGWTQGEGETGYTKEESFSTCCKWADSEKRSDDSAELLGSFLHNCSLPVSLRMPQSIFLLFLKPSGSWIKFHAFSFWGDGRRWSLCIDTGWRNVSYILITWCLVQCLAIVSLTVSFPQ